MWKHLSPKMANFKGSIFVLLLSLAKGGLILIYEKKLKQNKAIYDILNWNM